ncbi:MAG: immunoglobulin domain-containing protein [Holophaga sp.]|nr:immunoglobulin domain-containing protein [Holophaga sp.]
MFIPINNGGSSKHSEMTLIWRSGLSAALMGLALVFFVACGGKTTPTDPPTPPSPVAPSISTHPQNQSVIAGQTATFTVTAGGTTPLSYQWKRGTTNVGTNAASYTTATTTLTDNGAKFSVVVTNAAGHIDSVEATLTVTATPSSATLVDHTCTNLALVPAASITAAKNTLKIAYGHTSHGSQLITGMNALMATAGSPYTWNEGGTAGAMKLDDTAMGGDVGYHPAWVNNTRAYLGTPANTGRGTLHPDINVIIWSWCGQASDRTQQTMIDTYLAPMTLLESDYPGIKFVYMTGHLDGTGTSGNLHQRNEQIRAYCRAYNKIHFDFADIDSYDPSGNEFLSRGAGISADGCAYTGGNWANEWLAAHPTDPLATLANACDSCAHSERLNCIQKGRAAWWLWARLAGWNGQ